MWCRPAFFGLAALASCSAACAPMGSTWTETEAPKSIELQVVSESYVVKLDPKGRSLPTGESEELSGFLTTLGDLDEIEFSVRRTHKGLPLASLRPVERALVASGADERKVHRLAEIGFDYIGHWADVEIIAKRYVAFAPNCPDWSRAEIADNTNRASSNFGCATASAQAMSISNPKDLMRGRSLAPASGVHAAGAVERYDTDNVRQFPQNSTTNVGQ